MSAPKLQIMPPAMPDTTGAAAAADFKRLIEHGTDSIARRWLEAVRGDSRVPSS